MEMEFINKINLASDIWELNFTKPNAFIYQAGDYVDLAVPNVTAKMLSMSSNPREENLKFTVRIPVKPSDYKQALDGLKPRDKCFISPAIGNFNLPRIGDSKLLFIALGIGITPFRSILLEKELPDITLIYTAKPDEYIYENEVIKSQVKFIKKDTRINAEELTRLVGNLNEKLIYLSGPELACIELYAQLLHAGVERRQIKLEYFTGYSD